MIRNTNQSNCLRRLLCLAAACLLLSSAVFAQSTYGTITGVVTDPTAAVIRDATVEAKNNETSEVRTVKTDAEGFYRFVNLDPGSYTISASASGFARVEQKTSRFRPAKSAVWICNSLWRGPPQRWK